MKFFYLLLFLLLAINPSFALDEYFQEFSNKNNYNSEVNDRQTYINDRQTSIYSENFGYLYYIQNVKKTITKNIYKLEDDSILNQYSESFYDLTIDKDGNLIEYKMVKGTGDTKKDAVVETAIKNSTPFKRFYSGNKEFELMRIGVNVVTNEHLKPLDAVREYGKKVTEKIQQNYEVNKMRVNNKRLSFKADIKISKDGELLNVKMTESTGNADEDKRFLDAINAAAPFDKFPDECKEEVMTIKANFSLGQRWYFPMYPI